MVTLSSVNSARLKHISQGSLSYVFPRVSHKKKILGIFWRAAERQPPFCCSHSLLLTTCLPHWHEAAAGLQFLFLPLDPFFSFSESWVRCMICSEMNGPGFCKTLVATQVRGNKNRQGFQSTSVEFHVMLVGPA